MPRPLSRPAALAMLDAQLVSLDQMRLAIELLRDHVMGGLMRMHPDGSWEWTAEGERRFEEVVGKGPA